MTNNDILRRVRYVFNLSDSEVINTFAAADCTVTREQISDWLKKDEDEAFQEISDELFATFLNGLINTKRGKKDGEQPKPETKLNYNIIFRKLKIALNLQADEVLEILQLSDFVMSKHELSALFRKVGHKNYKTCKEQVLRLFLNGLQIKYRPRKDKQDEADEADETGFNPWLN